MARHESKGVVHFSTEVIIPNFQPEPSRGSNTSLSSIMIGTKQEAESEEG